MKKITLISTFIFALFIAKAQLTITVTVPNVKPLKGNIMLRLQNNIGADLEKKVVPIDTKNFTTTFTVSSKGRYAISIYHDVNKNNKLDKNFFGAPSEGFGFSNNVKEVFSEPTLKAKLFAVNTNTTISIKLNY